MRNFVGSIIKSNKVFNLIQDKDKICVGISGGKDSTLLFIAMNLYKQYVKNKFGWEIEIYGVHIDMHYYENIKYDEYLKYIDSKKLSIKIIDSNIGEILRAKTKKNIIQCSLCAKLKKAILVKEAKKMGCNKIAMGHHADDAIETMFLNMIHEGRISTFSPSTYFDRSDITMIRPFCLLREKIIINELKKEKIPLIKNCCPIDGKTERTYLKKFLNEVFYKDKKFNMSYENFLIALLNGKQSNLWFDDKNKKLDLIKLMNEK